MRTFIVSVLLASIWGIQGKPKPKDPPVWEYTYQFELFEKIYDQTQAIQKLLNPVSNVRCPNSWTKILDSCYFLPLHWKKRWLEAEEVCERIGGYLAILSSEEEDNLVSEYLRNISKHDLQDESAYIWIGGFDFINEGDWRWVNGEKLNYSNWRIALEDTPKHNKKTEDCLDWSDGWNDNNCNRKFHFLCERNPVESKNCI